MQTTGEVRRRIFSQAQDTRDLLRLAAGTLPAGEGGVRAMQRQAAAYDVLLEHFFFKEAVAFEARIAPEDKHSFGAELFALAAELNPSYLCEYVQWFESQKGDQSGDKLSSFPAWHYGRVRGRYALCAARRVGAAHDDA